MSNYSLQQIPEQHNCPKCGHPLRQEPHFKQQKIDGVYQTVGIVAILTTCDNPDCPRCGITLDLPVLLALTDEQAARYPRKDK